MLSRLYKDSHRDFDCPLNHRTRVLRSFEVSENGQIVKRSELVDTSVCDMYKDTFASDFSISNLISIGALGHLQDVSMRNSDVVGISKQLENLNLKPAENEN